MTLNAPTWPDSPREWQSWMRPCGMWISVQRRTTSVLYLLSFLHKHFVLHLITARGRFSLYIRKGIDKKLWHEAFALSMCDTEWNLTCSKSLEHIYFLGLNSDFIHQCTDVMFYITSVHRNRCRNRCRILSSEFEAGARSRSWKSELEAGMGNRSWKPEWETEVGSPSW